MAQQYNNWWKKNKIFLPWLMLGPSVRQTVIPDHILITDKVTGLILVSLERESALVVPFGVKVTGVFYCRLKFEKKSIFDQFFELVNFKEISVF